MKTKTITLTSPIAKDLIDKAKLFEAKDKEYGDNYMRAGKVFDALFPGGLHLDSVEELNRYALLNQIVNKVMRYASNFKKGGHADSLDDLAIYAMMTKEADEHFRSKK